MSGIKFTSPSQWKSEQREIMRAAFAPAFEKYSALVNAEDDPENWRKYLTFIAQQVGLEEPTFKAGPHDGLATVQINIGTFHQAASRLPSTPSRMPTAPAHEVLPMVDDVIVDVEEKMSAVDAFEASIGSAPFGSTGDGSAPSVNTALPVIEPEYDFDATLDALLTR